MSQNEDTAKDSKSESLNVKMSIAPPELIDVNLYHTNGAEDDVNDSRGERDAVKEGNNSMSWNIDDKPPVLLSLVLGFQHYLTMFGSTLALPFALSKDLCIDQDDFLPIAQLLGTIFFVSGIATFLQCTFGVRLPIVQGGTFSFLPPTIALLTQDAISCSAAASAQYDLQPGEELWHRKIRKVQGAILAASLVQVLVGVTGVMGWLLKYVGPLCIAPTITLVGLALFEEATYFAQQNWAISSMTLVLIALFSQYLVRFSIPLPFVNNTRLPIFKLFPVMLAILTSWLVCAILTISGLLPSSGDSVWLAARVDTKLDVIKQSPWIRIPYPFQWGFPIFTTAGTIGMMAGFLASMLESVGDYYACARLAGARKPELHAVNRGIFVEGVCCMIAAIFGTGNGTTSYSENVGAIGITKVGSRRVVQWASAMMLLMGCLGKFGAVFTTIPSPIIGGVFFTMFGMITGVGLSNLQMVDLKSTRNLFVLGISIFVGIALPKWVKQNPNAIDIGNEQLSQIVSVLLSTSMFIGGMTGFILDNTIPGSREERGLVAWNESAKDEMDASGSKTSSKTYQVPFLNKVPQKLLPLINYIPICPDYSTLAHEESVNNQKSNNSENAV